MNGTTLFETMSPNQASTSSTHSHTDHLNTSTTIQAPPKSNLFQSTKQPDKNQLAPPKKKNKLFETITNDASIPKQTNHSTTKKLPSMKHEEKSKENYLDLLIISMEGMMSSGEISLDYLHSETPSKSKAMSYTNHIEDDQLLYSKKCENRICAVVVDKINSLYNANIVSFKSNNYLLCKKCHEAWKQEQYCFYCNVIYREFAFNQQYNDSKKWIECDYCEKWQHIECEEKYGCDGDIEEMNKNEEFKYMCPICRDKKGVVMERRIEMEENEEEGEIENKESEMKMIGKKKKRTRRSKGKKCN